MEVLYLRTVRKTLAIVLAIVLLAWGGYYWYTAQSPSDTSTKNIIALGHGGMGTRAWQDINTRESFLKALNTGADGTEMDVQLTEDGVLVAFHDEYVGEAKCPQHIYKHTLSELRGCIGEILSVSEVLALGWKDGSVFSLDVKLYGTNVSQQEQLTAQINSLKAEHPQFRILAESNDPNFLQLLKDSGIEDGIYVYTEDAQTGLSLCLNQGFEGISIRNDLITDEAIGQCQNQGIQVMLWGLGSRWHNREAVLRKPDIIQSDRLEHLVDLLGKK